MMNQKYTLRINTEFIVTYAWSTFRSVAKKFHTKSIIKLLLKQTRLL